MSQEHRYDMSQLEHEEATMEAEDVLETKLKRQKADHVRTLLTEYVTYRGRGEPKSYSVFEWTIWPDWKDGIDTNTIELVRLNLACGDREKAGMVLVESLEEYMDEIAARAVREDMNHDA